MRVGRHAYGMQYHCEILPQTVSDWAVIPAYACALDAALGDDQCRDAAKKVQIAFIINETEVASAKPPVFSERLQRLFFEIAIAGENAWATCEYFALASQAAQALFFFGRPNAQLNASDRFADAVERALTGEIERQ
jgi:hypothetical protein